MTTLLYIKASPRGERSHSVAAGDAFVAEYRRLHPDHTINVLDVFERDLPRFDGDAVTARFHAGRFDELSPAQQKAWDGVKHIIEEFKAADKYVFALPMWNFGIPWRLKQYIDLLVQPGLTFTYDAAGYHGLVTGKPVFASYARGGEYPAGTPAEGVDFQKRYLEFVLGFIGFTDIRSVVVEPTLAAGPDAAQEKRQAAMARAVEMAGAF